MKPLALLLLFGLLFSQNATAQKPWRAKLFVHFLDSNNQIVTDTVWFGADSLGDIGYQLGLDVIDTNIHWNKVYSSDEPIKFQYNTDCSNLKTNIIKMGTQATGGMKFKFYATGNPIAMSWDTMDFIYRIDSTYRISGIFITANNGYIYGLDATQYIIGGDSYEKINMEYSYLGFSFNTDSVRLFPESLIPECNKVTAFSFELKISMGWFKPTGLNSQFLKKPIKVYPNPIHEKLIIEFGENLPLHGFHYSIVSLPGIEQLQGPIYNYSHEIDTKQLTPGIYFLQLYDGDNLISKPYKIIKP